MLRDHRGRDLGKINERFGGSTEKFTIPPSLANFSQGLENTPYTIMDNRGSCWQFTILPAGGREGYPFGAGPA